MEKILNNIKSNKHKIIMYLTIIVIAFIMCGPFFRFHLALDSYKMAIGDTSEYCSMFNSISGRPISDLVLYYTRVIGLDMMNNQQLYTFISIVIMLLATITLYETCQELIKSKAKAVWISAIASILIIFNAFGFEMFLFNVMFSLSIQYLLVVWSVKLLLKELNVKNVIIAILFNLIGLCIYQAISPIFLGVAIVLFGYKYKDSSLFKNIKNYIIIGVIYGVACVGNYILIKLAVVNRYEGSSLRGHLSAVLARQRLLWIDTYNFFPKYSFVAICIILVLIFILIIIKHEKKNIFKMLISLGGAIAAIIVGAYIPHILSATMIIPRTALSISCIPGIILLFIGLYYNKIGNYTKILIAVISTVYILLCINTSAILVDKLVDTNNRDKEIAREMLDIIEEYEKNTGIKVDKMSFTFDDAITWGYNNGNPIFGVEIYIKAFNVAWARADIFEYYYNRKFTQVVMDEGIYEEHFKGKNWNEFDKEQIIIIEDTAYISTY